MENAEIIDVKKVRKLSKEVVNRLRDEAESLGHEIDCSLLGALKDELEAMYLAGFLDAKRL